MKLKRYLAAALACLITATAFADLTPEVSYAAGNLISNSTFDSGTSGWGTYKESGGACSLSTSDGKLALNISSVGSLNYSVQVYYDIIPLYQNATYRLKYDISCSMDRFVEGMIQQNGGTYQAYTWKGLDISPTPQTVDYTF
ncbi:MAG: glycosyl hydrolase family 9, cellulase, partial [Ruminococcus sp.]|nr:glycosyl hydrolase family 9, cellulase [Ruminococcus sp.]